MLGLEPEFGLVVFGVWLGLFWLGLVVSGVWLGLWLGLCVVLLPDCPVEDPLGVEDWATTQAPHNRTVANKVIFPNFMMRRPPRN